MVNFIYIMRPHRTEEEGTHTHTQRPRCTNSSRRNTGRGEAWAGGHVGCGVPGAGCGGVAAWVGPLPCHVSRRAFSGCLRRTHTLHCARLGVTEATSLPENRPVHEERGLRWTATGWLRVRARGVAREKKERVKSCAADDESGSGLACSSRAARASVPGREGAGVCDGRGSR